MFCQLETLRHCLPPSVRRTLDELPESLDETYERILREIKRPNRDHSRRLLQCLVVAIRPLEVKELAEVLAVDFDDAEGIPKLKPNWRWEDEEQALLTSCSSLIAIVDTENSRVVQFAHFSVKEYLTSKRLATSSGDAPRYHIDLESAHTILAHACLSILLQADGRVEESGIGKRSPLAEYAARHWVTHAQFERVAACLQRAMEYLFDKDKPYFAAWLQLHNIDNPSTGNSWSLSAQLFKVLAKSNISPLYYAALYGFEDLVKLLVVKYPQDVNASGYTYLSPLAAALARKHFQTVKLLYRNGAHVDIRGNNGETLFISALWSGDLEKVQVLLDCKADVNIRGPNDLTPIQYVSQGSRLVFIHQNIPQLLPDLAQLLLEHGADVNVRNRNGSTALHLAAEYGRVEVMRVLLRHDANADAKDSQGRTPFHAAAGYGGVEVVRVLLEHGANADAEDKEGRSPFHLAGSEEVVRVLLERGANVGAEDIHGKTPLHVAADYGRVEVGRVLLKHGADVDAEDNQDITPLLVAVEEERVEVVRILLEHGANADAKDIQGRFPLFVAVHQERDEVVQMLLEHGADADVKDNQGRTPLHVAAAYRRVEFGRVLLEHGADADARDSQGRTPLHVVLGQDRLRVKDEFVQVLLEHGANVDGKDSQGRTPLHVAANGRDVEVGRVLLEHGANADAEDSQGRTPLHAVLGQDKLLEKEEFVRMLLEHGANADGKDSQGRTPLHLVANYGGVDAGRVLLEHGANAEAEDSQGRTPLLVAVAEEKNRVACVLLEHGANADAKDNQGRTPLTPETLLYLKWLMNLDNPESRWLL